MLETPKNQKVPNNSSLSGGYSSGLYGYSSQWEGIEVTNVRSGEYHVTKGAGEMMVTILGSCIATCIYDPVSKIAGMNHFLMPGGFDAPPSPKYGIFAMEYMINEILKRGSVKTRLIVKVFGGASMMSSNQIQIGKQNISFIKEYLANESLQIASSDVGGDFPRRVHFFGDTGKVMLQRLEKKEEYDTIVSEEERFTKELKASSKKPLSGSIELFD